MNKGMKVKPEESDYQQMIKFSTTDLIWICKNSDITLLTGLSCHIYFGSVIADVQRGPKHPRKRASPSKAKERTILR